MNKQNEISYKEAYNYLINCGFTIWEEKDKETCPIFYPKKLGNYKYIIISDDNECYLKTNDPKVVIEFALEMNRLENEFK